MSCAFGPTSGTEGLCHLSLLSPLSASNPIFAPVPGKVMMITRVVEQHGPPGARSSSVRSLAGVGRARLFALDFNRATGRRLPGPSEGVFEIVEDLDTHAPIHRNGFSEPLWVEHRHDKNIRELCGRRRFSSRESMKSPGRAALSTAVWRLSSRVCAARRGSTDPVQPDRVTIPSTPDDLTSGLRRFALLAVGFSTARIRPAGQGQAAVGSSSTPALVCPYVPVPQESWDRTM